MFQLKWNNDYSKIERDIKYWKNEINLPKHIITYITTNSDNIALLENYKDTYYCGKCLNKLTKKGYCSKCHKQFTIFKESDNDYYYNKQTCRIKLNDYSHYINYFVFDFYDDNIYLYYLTEKVTYEQTPLKDLLKKSNIIVNNSYLVEKNGLTDLEANLFISFQELATYNNQFQLNQSNLEYDNKTSLYSNIFDNQLAFVYLDNLATLKNTIYKYSRLWLLKDILANRQTINLAMLSFYPLYYPQFEYLVNYHLYNLALEAPFYFKNGRNFQEIFKVDKKYLSFMAENNLNYRELIIMQINPTTDFETLKFFGDWLEPYYYKFCELVNDYKVNLQDLKEYLFSSKEDYFLPEYIDYFNMAKELKLDLKEKKVLYPQSLQEAHDKLYDQIIVLSDPVYDEKIKNLANLLIINKYEDDEYVIYPASSIEELVEESRQQKNCVRTYYDRIANYECQVYFMRRKKNLSKSFVTIEVNNDYIVQARLKYNKQPDSKIIAILQKWESTLIPVITEE